MNTRPDISYKLIHFTSGETNDDAFRRLCSILAARHLRGSCNKIKGGHVCVCFSEAPLANLRGGLVNPESYSRYSPFGLMFEKRWIFSQGGRPAIYQPDEEYDHLPDPMKWRHVRYEPNRQAPIDFTWEREWRINRERLTFDSAVASIVVPDASWAQRLAAEHEAEQDFLVLQYSQVMDELLAEQYREDFRWRVCTLS